ncbi:elafin [Lycaon pictus]|uniref:Peptidase inhibitor 3 n=3 Tax=Canis lupus TaxID=9612 RepID=D3DMB4_CANLF|nr:elafin precursor [Canis lupus familiaris]XP_025325982.1 elafin [Canis lupus dingo]FAA00665.1 TPA: trappin-2 [Canis lupus familiaris]|eukprot:NP_001277028.1 elafin precursor [Canis lupus familiaris]
MRPSSFLVLAVFLILGTLAAQAAVTGVLPKGSGTDRGRVPVKGQDPVRGRDPVKAKGPVSTKPGSCPPILIQCAMLNPPNRCLSDTECPGARKCCKGPCGLACLQPQ